MEVDWDHWRATYRETSYTDQLRFYDVVGAAYPDQHFYNLPAIRSFVRRVVPRHVFELGGWRGELAADILPKAPSILEWRNYEISKFAVESAIVGPPYHAEVPQRWIWEHDPFLGFDCAIMAHVVEHMLVGEFERLLEKLPDVTDLFIQTPLHLEPRDWTGYQGTHIIEVGWGELIRRTIVHGFMVVETSIDGPEMDRFATFSRHP